MNCTRVYISYTPRYITFKCHSFFTKRIKEKSTKEKITNNAQTQSTAAHRRQWKAVWTRCGTDDYGFFRYPTICFILKRMVRILLAAPGQSCHPLSNLYSIAQKQVHKHFRGWIEQRRKHPSFSPAPVGEHPWKNFLEVRGGYKSTGFKSPEDIAVLANRLVKTLTYFVTL